jgi:hypothetical protein
MSALKVGAQCPKCAENGKLIGDFPPEKWWVHSPRMMLGHDMWPDHPKPTGPRNEAIYLVCPYCGHTTERYEYSTSPVDAYDDPEDIKDILRAWGID